MSHTFEGDDMVNAESSYRASPNIVYKLQKMVQSMAENDGNMVAEEIWHEEDIERYVSSIIAFKRRSINFSLPALTSNVALEQAYGASDRDASISVANSRLKRMEELLGAIYFLKSSLQRRISHFRQHKPSRTITDLPDELLVLIFDIARPRLSELSWLSLVCKRFRRITISVPSLWARLEISSSMPQRMTDMIVVRSGKHSLCLNVSSPLTSNNAIFKYCDRWSEITLDDLLTEPDLHIFQTLAPSTKLTSMCKLSLTGAPHELRSYFFNGGWRPAALSSLHCSSALPAALTASALTSFHFDSNIIDIGDLVTFLCTTPLLEDLSIVLGETEEMGSDEDVTVELPLLKSFSFHSYGADRSAVEEVLQAIVTPNILTLEINITAAAYVDGQDTSSSFWAVVEWMKYKFLNLRKLDLAVVRGDFEPGDEDSYMNQLFARLPKSIESISLMARNAKLLTEASHSIGNFENLRSVRFNNCNRLGTQFFKRLATQFKRAEIQLDDMEVLHCRDIYSKEDIEGEMARTLFKDAGVLGTQSM